MRSATRLSSGGVLGRRATLLEHTLVLPGDMVDKDTTVQGTPTSEYTGSNVIAFVRGGGQALKAFKLDMGNGSSSAVRDKALQNAFVHEDCQVSFEIDVEDTRVQSNPVSSTAARV